MIRPVSVADAADIAGIYNYFITDTDISFETEPLSPEQMADRIADYVSRGPYFVYELDGRVAGYCYAHEWKERKAYSLTLETSVYVDPQHHRQGIGLTLMERLIEECRKRGYVALIACITGDNEPSIKLHLRLGFRQVSLFRKVGSKFGRLLDVVDFELLL